MAVVEGLVVHVVGEHGELVVHLFNGVHVVVHAAVGAVAERVEHHPPCAGLRVDEFEDRRHGDAAPFRDTAPALDAEVLVDLADLGVLRECPQLYKVKPIGWATRPPTCDR